MTSRDDASAFPTVAARRQDVDDFSDADVLQDHAALVAGTQVKFMVGLPAALGHPDERDLPEQRPASRSRRPTRSTNAAIAPSLGRNLGVPAAAARVQRERTRLS